MVPETVFRLSRVKVVRWGFELTLMDPVRDVNDGRETALMARPEMVREPLKVEQPMTETRSSVVATWNLLAHASIRESRKREMNGGGEGGGVS